MAIPKLDLTKLNKKTLASNEYDPTKQVEGYKKRLEASGLDPNKETDSRNFIEKALNLTPDQNVFFDVFEILERPQQAFFNAWKAKQEGKDVGEAIKNGISGNDVVRFKEILHNYGMADSAEKFGVDDVAGLLGDILLDPIDLPLIPATGGASAIAKATGKADEAAKVAKKLVEGGKAFDAVGATATAVKAAERVADLKKTRLISPLQGVFRLAKSGGKATFKMTDTVLTNVLTKLDSYGDVAKKAKEGLLLADNYSNIKRIMKQTFNAAAEVPASIMSKFRTNMGKKAWTEAELKVVYQNWYKNDFKGLSKILDMGEDELGELMQGYLEWSRYRPKVTLEDMFHRDGIKDMLLDEKTVTRTNKFFETYLPESKIAKKADLWELHKLDNGVEGYRLNQKYFDKLKEEIDLVDPTGTIRVSQEGVEGIVPLGTQTTTVEEINPILKSMQEEFDAPRFYSEEQIKKYEQLGKNEVFTEGVEKARKLQEDMLQRIDEAFDTALKEGTPEGYLRHSMTDERKAVDFNNKLDFEVTDKTSLRGNINTYTGRQYKMSAEEANLIYKDKIKVALERGNLTDAQKAFWESQKGMELFETSINSSLADFIDTAPKFAEDIKQLDDVLLTSTFLNPEVLQPISETHKLQAGFKKVSKSDIVKKMNGMKKYVPEETAKKFDEFIKKLPPTNSVAMDATVYEMIGRLGQKEETKLLVRLLDVMNNAFKKFKLLSPGFQMRNMAGNMSNMYLAGIPVNDIVKGINKSANIFKEAPDIMRKATLEGVEALSEKQKVIYDAYREFVEKGFHDISKEVWDVENIITSKKLAKTQEKRNAIKWVTDKNFEINQIWDERFRMTALQYAKENPEVYLKLGLDSPEAFVRHALFDPKDLSRTEREVMRRAIPFYTFTKKNLAFQMKNVFDNPRKYNHLRKTIRGTWDVFANIDVNDIEDYKKENMWIPVPTMKGDGTYSAIKLNLPVGDLAEFVQNPVKKTLASLTPAVRAPFEAMTNKQIYTGMPIEEFKGQKGYTLPFFNRKLEYTASQFGLDVPAGLGYDIGDTAVQAAKGNVKSVGQGLQQSIGGSIFSQGSIEKSMRSRAYQELNQMRELLRYYKQENIDILTLSEAENKNSTLSALSAKLKSLLR